MAASVWHPCGDQTNRSLSELGIHLGQGQHFDLNAYVDSRGDVTREFAARLPAMVSFVHTFVRAGVAGLDPRSLGWKTHRKLEKPELTAKSYFLAEAEAISRLAKLDWALPDGRARSTRSHCQL